MEVTYLSEDPIIMKTTTLKSTGCPYKGVHNVLHKTPNRIALKDTSPDVINFGFRCISCALKVIHHILEFCFWNRIKLCKFYFTTRAVKIAIVADANRIHPTVKLYHKIPMKISIPEKGLLAKTVYLTTHQ